MGCGASVSLREFSKVEHEKINNMLREECAEEDVLIEELQLRREVISHLAQSADRAPLFADLNVCPSSFLDVVDNRIFKEQRDVLVSVDVFKEFLLNERRSYLAVVTNIADSCRLLIDHEDPIRIRLEVMGALAATMKTGSRVEHVIVHLEATARENKEAKAREKAKEDEKPREKDETQDQEALGEPTTQDLCGLLRVTFEEFTIRNKLLKRVDEKLETFVLDTTKEAPNTDATAKKIVNLEQITELPSPPVFSGMMLPRPFSLKDAVKGKVPKVQELMQMLDRTEDGSIRISELQSAIQKQEFLSVSQDLGVDFGCVFLVLVTRGADIVRFSDFADLLWHYQVSNPVLVSHIHDVRRILWRQSHLGVLDSYSGNLEETWASITGSKGPQRVQVRELMKMFERKTDTTYISRVEVSLPKESLTGILLSDIFDFQRVITKVHSERIERLNKIVNKLEEAFANGSKNSAQT